jgi:hypothetical protein
MCIATGSAGPADITRVVERQVKGTFYRRSISTTNAPIDIKIEPGQNSIMAFRITGITESLGLGSEFLKREVRDYLKELIAKL